MKTTLRNFCVANIFAVLPALWWALGWMPDQVKVYWKGCESYPVSIMANGVVLGGEAYGQWNEGTVWRFYLREGMTWRGLLFRLPEHTGSERVAKIELQKWKLLKFGKAGTGLVPAGEGGDGYVFTDGRFDWIGFASAKIMLGLVALELLLLLTSWWRVRQKREEKGKKILIPSMLVALSLTALLQVALPEQIYLANQSAFPFSGTELMFALSVRFAWVFPLTAVALGALAFCFGPLVLGFALAFAVCIYLESGILAQDLPTLNGDWWFFQNRTRALWDVALWAGVFATIIALHPVLKKRYGLVALCLSVMVLASMFDVIPEEKADKKQLIVDRFCSLETVIRNVTYSTNRNVLVFVLDSLEREPAHAVMQDPEAGPELREQFRGFTEYLDNVGTGNTTLTAVPTLLTGEYPSDDAGRMDFFWSMYGTNSVLADFLSAGWNAYVTTPGLGCGYAGGKIEEDGELSLGESIWTRPMKDGQPWTLSDITRFRMLPFGIKAPYAYLVGIGGGEKMEPREWNVYPLLGRADIGQGNPGVFLFVHTGGVHLPVMYDRHGHLLPSPASGENRDAEMGVYLLAQLGQLFDCYRERGLYDGATILVLADHGQHGARAYRQSEKDGKLPPNACPFLWIKPAGSQNAFGTSFLPTSHARICSLLKDLVQTDLGKEEIEDVLCAGKRRYRWVALNGVGWRDWIVDKDGTISFEESEPTEATVKAEMLPLHNGKTYFLGAKHAMLYKENPVFFHVENIGYPSLRSGEREMSFAFKVGKANKKYILRFAIKGWDHSGMHFRQDIPGVEWVDATLNGGEDQTIVLHGLLPDSDGIVKIIGERLGGEEGTIRFTQLVVDEE